MIGEKELTIAMSAPATRAAAYWTGSENYVADRILEELPGLIGEVTQRHHRRDDRRPHAAGPRREVDPQAGRRERRDAQCQPGRARVDRQFGRGARDGRRLRLRQQPVRPRVGSAPAAGLGLQAVRLHGGARTGSHARQRPQRRADQDRQVDARELQRQVFRQGHAGDRAGKIAEFGRRAAGHGGRSRGGGRGGASHGHRIRAAGQHLDRARHVGGDAARTDGRLRAVRQWRLPAGRAFRPAHHDDRRRGALRVHRRQQPARRALRCRRHDELDDDRHRRDGHREEGGLRLARRRQDRHQPEIARRLVRRLHGEPDDRRLVRQ